jgi:phosphopantothenoylcysteine decarboxylase/phosphopantothenate--cysteine ligase
MGFALARAAAQAGADVHLVAGPTSLATPWGVTRSNVQTAQQMYDAVMADASRNDIFIAVAAVADWRVRDVAREKIKKTGDADVPTLEFVQNPDILAAVAQLPKPPYCVGFAAESGDLEKNGAQKRLRKQVPLLVGNLGPATFGRDDNEVILFDDAGQKRLPRADKRSLARSLIIEIAARLPSRAPG